MGDTFLDFRPSMTRTVYKLAKICDWLSLIKDEQHAKTVYQLSEEEGIE